MKIIARIKSDYFTAPATRKRAADGESGGRQEGERQGSGSREGGKERHLSNCEYKFRVLFSLPAPS